MNSAYPIFEDCNIYKNEWNGIYVEDDADVSLTNCDLYDNAAGDFVTRSANPIISLMEKFSDEEDD